MGTHKNTIKVLTQQNNNTLLIVHILAKLQVNILGGKSSKSGCQSSLGKEGYIRDFNYIVHILLLK